jgi:hypothetical protein
MRLLWVVISLDKTMFVEQGCYMGQSVDERA